MNSSQKLKNVSNILEYLRSKEKMRRRHLWDPNPIINKDKKVIFELLSDIYDFYSYDNISLSLNKSMSKINKSPSPEKIKKEEKPKKELGLKTKIEKVEENKNNNQNNIHLIRNESNFEKINEPSIFFTLDQTLNKKISTINKIRKKHIEDKIRINEESKGIDNCSSIDFIKLINSKRSNSSFHKTSYSPTFINSDTSRSPIGINLKEEYLNSIEYIKKVNVELNTWLKSLNIKGFREIDFSKEKIKEFENG